MARLTWTGPRHYKVGVDRGVFYTLDGIGEAWSGLIAIREAPTEADGIVTYIDGLKRQNNRRLGTFAGSVEAFTFPKSFYENVPTKRRLTNFGFSYRVRTESSYKIHLVYNASFSPEGFSYQQFGNDTFRWNFTTLPMFVPNAALSSHLVIDANEAYPWTIEALENVLYGSETETSRLPSPKEVFDIFENNAILQVVDNHDGTFTVTAPDSVLEMLDETTFQITWPSAVYIDENRYNISSL